MAQTTQSISIDDTCEVAPLHSSSLTGDVVPQRVLLAPWGHVESTNGDFIVDDESVRLAIEAFDAHGTDLPIDYEHQTLGGAYSSPNGQAPAAGWIKRLVAEPSVGLLAEIEWTEQAKTMLANKEYRYLSPVAIIRKRDRKLAAIHSAALTNKPAIHGMHPIINSSEIEQDNVDEEPLMILRTELDLPTDAPPEQVLTVASQRLVVLQREAKQQRVEERIREAMRAGKLVEAQRAWAEALVASEESLFEEWLRTAPVVVQVGAIAAPSSVDRGQRRKHATVSRARAEFHTSPVLQTLTTEDAYVADAIRQSA